MNAPATNTTAAPAGAAASRIRGFNRGTPATTPPAPGAAPQGDASTSPPGDDAAQPEQASSFDALVNIDYDAAMSHDSAGKYRGTIKTAKPNGKGTGFWVGVVSSHDSTLAGMNFMQWREDAGKLDPKTGKPVRTPDVVGRKAWATFCGQLGLDPAATARDLVAYAKREIPDCPLVGTEAVFDFTAPRGAGGMGNCSLDAEATAQMANAAE